MYYGVKREKHDAFQKVEEQYNKNKIVVKIENNYTKRLANKIIDKFINPIHWNLICQGKNSNRREVERTAFDSFSTIGITKLIDSFKL